MNGMPSNAALPVPVVPAQNTRSLMDTLDLEWRSR